MRIGKYLLAFVCMALLALAAMVAARAAGNQPTEDTHLAAFLARAEEYDRGDRVYEGDYSYNYTYINLGRVFGRRERRTATEFAFHPLSDDRLPDKWKHSGGEQLGPGVGVRFMISLPEGQKPQHSLREDGSHRFDYPVGTAFLVERSQAGAPTMLRLRHKTADGWESAVYDRRDGHWVEGFTSQDCAGCHQDAGRVVTAADWEGRIGADENFSYLRHLLAAESIAPDGVNLPVSLSSRVE